MTEKHNAPIISQIEDDDAAIHNSLIDKVMILASAFVAGSSLALVACLVLHYKWYIGVLYFIGMFVWVILFYEYFNYSLFRRTAHGNE
ncbi:hypothetical protein KDK77_09580 [bacterium]|nr:hypothetical protein [bacterium]MCP5462159.1 hypothetical protein [bacterium]